MQSSRNGSLIRLLYLIVIASMQIVLFAAFFRLNSSAFSFTSYPRGISFLAFSFIGSSSWHEMNDPGIVRFLCVVFCLLTNFGIFCGTLVQILLLIGPLNIQIFSRILRNISKRPTPHEAQKEQLSGSDDTDSWVKRHLPGWYYKVTVPNREFKKKVASAVARESAVSDSLTDLHDSQSRLNLNGDMIVSLREIAVDFASALCELQGRMTVEKESIEARLREVNELTKQVAQRI